jgi:hypothetical protein
MKDLLSLDRNCKSCSLSCGEATFGAGPDDLNQVKLIVISDFTGAYEAENNYPFWPNDEKRAPKRMKRSNRYTVEAPRNAGSMLRYRLRELFGLDTYNDVWMTNVIKCPIKDKKPQDKNARDCANRWLKDELAVLDQYVPEVPILVAGSTAFKGLKFIFPELGKSLSGSLSDFRRTNNYRLGAHPLVFTTNPAPVARSEFRIEVNVGLDSDDTYSIQTVKTIPPIPGSPPWHFDKDLEFLSPFL